MAISSRWRAFIRDANGKRQLRHITNHSVTDEATKTNVAGPEAMIGKVSGTGGFAISLTSKKQADLNPEADWFGLRDDDEDFVLEIQYLGPGNPAPVIESHIYTECGVANVNSTGDSAGEVSMEISITTPFRQIVR